MEQLKHVAFVLVAGGLGERLGFASPGPEPNPILRCPSLTPLPVAGGPDGNPKVF